MLVLFYMNPGKNCPLFVIISQSFSIVSYDLWQNVCNIILYNSLKKSELFHMKFKITQLLFS